MVTHDPSAAAYADRVVFLADGLLVDSMQAPTTERVLDRMKAFDSAVDVTPGSVRIVGSGAGDGARRRG
jgi:putative ABC transport system ATP-binding protein